MNNSEHANVEQLLEIKDGISNSASEHVRNCEPCQEEIGSLLALSEQIFIDANLPADPDVWERIKATHASNATTDRQRYQHVPMELLAANMPAQASQASLSKAIYSLAASVLVTGFIGLYLFGQQNISNNQQNRMLQANIQELMLNSRGMERSLEKVALQNEMLTASEQSAADRLYWRLTYVDQLIHENNADNQVDPARMEMLWSDRINALT